MARLIWVPQLPIKMRYQEWWINEFCKHLEFDEVLTLGMSFSQFFKHYHNAENDGFSAPFHATRFELEQINDFINLDLKPNDFLLLADLSFPGFFASMLTHNTNLSKKRCFAICHATSFNYLDYFEEVRDSKFNIESAHASLFNKVFVATEYHKRKLGWLNTQVLPFPYPPFQRHYFGPKIYPLISVARNHPQKRQIGLENDVEDLLKTRIYRASYTSWEGYYKAIAQSQCMIITAQEETYGYQIIDAVLNDCVPIAPSRLSYPELLPPEYLYKDLADLVKKIEAVFSGELKVPKLLVHDRAKNFYHEISEVMKNATKT